MILGRKREKDAEIGELLEFKFSPGYCDMAGGHHYENLHRDETGQWVIVSRNRNVFSDPASVMTYAVSEEAVREFVSFIAEKKVHLRESVALFHDQAGDGSGLAGTPQRGELRDEFPVIHGAKIAILKLKV